MTRYTMHLTEDDLFVIKNGLRLFQNACIEDIKENIGAHDDGEMDIEFCSHLRTANLLQSTVEALLIPIGGADS